MDEPLWVFGYGSLLWDPGFAVAESHKARLDGFHRSFSMRSIHHRGTPEHQGLVLALDRAEGAFCEGMAFRAADPDHALPYLRERELISSAYLEEWHDIKMLDGRAVRAVCYVVDRDHVQYCQIPLEEQAQIIAHAVGGRGPNREYLWNTTQHLEELGLPDPDLMWLSDRVRALRADAPLA